MSLYFHFWLCLVNKVGGCLGVFSPSRRHTSLHWFVAQLSLRAWKMLKQILHYCLFMAYRANVGVFSVLDLPLAGQNLEFFLVMIQWSDRKSVGLIEKSILYTSQPLCCYWWILNLWRGRGKRLLKKKPKSRLSCNLVGTSD